MALATSRWRRSLAMVDGTNVSHGRMLVYRGSILLATVVHDQ